MFNLGELVLPFRRELGLRECVDAKTAHELHKLKCLGIGHKRTLFAAQILLLNQTFNGLRTRGRRTESLFCHGIAQLIRFELLACRLHCGEERRICKARRGPRLICMRLNMRRQNLFTVRNGNKIALRAHGP